LFEEFWEGGKTIQLAGKDQVRFQSLIWQAMLISAGIKNTDQIIYHGFITSGGQKMSKSLGNVINPLDLVAEYGTDAVRYFLARHVQPYEDSDVTLEKFKEAYNANLANGLGNLVSRIMKMAETNLEDYPRLEAELFPSEYTESLDKFNAHQAIEYIFGLISELDQKITLEEPFKLVKTDKTKGTRSILECLLKLYVISFLLEPFMPETSRIIKEAIEKHKKPENLFPRKD
jgi:methionyl-tRNA synthetase